MKWAMSKGTIHRTRFIHTTQCQWQIGNHRNVTGSPTTTATFKILAVRLQWLRLSSALLVDVLVAEDVDVNVILLGRLGSKHERLHKLAHWLAAV